MADPLYIQQPQMREAVDAWMAERDYQKWRSDEALGVAFAAVDREALIEQGAAALCAIHNPGRAVRLDSSYAPFRRKAEAVIAAIGVIPEQRAEPDGDSITLVCEECTESVTVQARNGLIPLAPMQGWEVAPRRLCPQHAALAHGQAGTT